MMRLLLVLLALLVPLKPRKKSKKKSLKYRLFRKMLEKKLPVKAKKRKNPFRRIRNAFRLISALILGAAAFSILRKSVNLGMKTVEIGKKLSAKLPKKTA